MRLLMGIGVVALLCVGCSQDTALGDPVTPAPGPASSSSLPPVGHGGPLDHQSHPAAVRGSSSGMAGGEAASGTLTRPIDPAENTGFAPDSPLEGTPAQTDGAPAAADLGDSATTDRDRELNQRIRLALSDDRSLAESVSRLQLSTIEGVVTLQGQIASEDGKEQLEKAVAAQEGVKQVLNQVTVGAQ